MTCQETAKDPSPVTNPVLYGAGSVTAAASYTGVCNLPQGKRLWTLTSTWAMQNCTQTPWHKADATSSWHNGRDPSTWTWSRAAGSRRPCWTRQPPEVSSDLTHSVTVWLYDVSCTSNGKRHWGFEHFLLHWNCHLWEGGLGVCRDVSRNPIQKMHTHAQTKPSKVSGSLYCLQFSLRQRRLLPEPAIMLYIRLLASVVYQQSCVAV